eukprot:458231-Pyramimonas_sp.AAC.1
MGPRAMRRMVLFDRDGASAPGGPSHWGFRWSSLWGHEPCEESGGMREDEGGGRRRGGGEGKGEKETRCLKENEAQLRRWVGGEKKTWEGILGLGKSGGRV